MCYAVAYSLARFELVCCELSTIALKKDCLLSSEF